MNHLLARTFLNIKRSGWRSYAVIFMMTVTFFILGVLLTVIYTSASIASFLVGNIEVIGFFKDGVSEEQILQVKRDAENLTYVTSVKYVSKEDAMKAFLEDNKENPDVVASVTSNPFPAHLNVKVADLERSKSDLIDSIDDSKEFLLVLRNIVLGIQAIGLILLAIFTLSTFFVVVMAIGITIYSHKNEIIIMKLVGATNWYVRSPYVMQSIVFAFISVLIASAIWVPIVLTQYNNLISSVAGDLNIAQMTPQLVLIGVGIEFAFALIIGVLSSYLATRRYIRY